MNLNKNEPVMVTGATGYIAGWIIKKLLDTGKVETRGKDINVSAEVKQFQFSGHADRDSLFDMIKNLKGNPKIMTVHGDDESCTRFAEEIHERFGFDAHAAKLDERITI